MPYMAIDVLRGYPQPPDGGPSLHTASHDLESLFFVLMHLCINTGGSLQRWPVANIDQWASLNPTTPWFNSVLHFSLAEIKCKQVDDFENLLLAFVEPYFEDMKPMLDSLHRVIFCSHMGASVVTHNQILDILVVAMHTVQEFSLSEIQAMRAQTCFSNPVQRNRGERLVCGLHGSLDPYHTPSIARPYCHFDLYTDNLIGSEVMDELIPGVFVTLLTTSEAYSEASEDYDAEWCRRWYVVHSNCDRFDPDSKFFACRSFKGISDLPMEVNSHYGSETLPESVMEGIVNQSPVK